MPAPGTGGDGRIEMSRLSEFQESCMLLRVPVSGRTASVVAAVVALTLPGMSFAQTTPSPQAPAATAATAAAKPDPSLPSGRDVVDKFVKAIGGREAVMSHKSMHVTGTYEVPASGLSGDMEIFTAANPNRAVQRVTIPGVGEVIQGFDGERGWSINPMTGPMLQQGKELEQAKLDADFYSELRDAKNYKSITTVAKTDCPMSSEPAPGDVRSCYKVSLVRSDGLEDFDFYDTQTGLRVASIQTRESPMGPVQSTNIEGAYKKFGNLLQPTSLIAKVMGVEQKITVSTIEYDAVPPSAFEPPAAIKALIK
jgi:hypothetical protein